MIQQQERTLAASWSVWSEWGMQPGRLSEGDEAAIDRLAAADAVAVPLVALRSQLLQGLTNETVGMQGALLYARTCM